MTSVYSARLKAIIPGRPDIEGLLTSLDEMLSKIGLRDFELNVIPPDIPDILIDLLPEMTEEEADAELAFFDEGEEILPPPGPPIPQDIIPAVELDMGGRMLKLKLQVFSEVVIDLFGLEGLSLVLNPHGFEATVEITNAGVEVEFTLELA
ncbi:MAG: hypothetical protein JSW07_07830, partial [bacterium]